MIWDNYLFRRGADVQELWDEIYATKADEQRPMRLLYIAGRGFDLRANIVLERFVDRLASSRCHIEAATLLRVGLSGYQLATTCANKRQKIPLDLRRCSQALAGGRLFQSIISTNDEDDITTTMALRHATDQVLRMVDGCTKTVVLDVSSLPRIVYLTILLALLAKLIPNNEASKNLFAEGVTLHVLVGEDPTLDSKISSEDPSNDLVLIPGYAEALQAETLQESPLI